MKPKKRGPQGPTMLGAKIMAMLAGGMPQCKVCKLTGASRSLVSYYARKGK